MYSGELLEIELLFPIGIKANLIIGNLLDNKLKKFSLIIVILH